MAGEVDKVIQQDQAAVSPPVAKLPTEESGDVEMSEAPPAKEPEQPAVAPPADTPKPTEPGESSAEVPKDALKEPVKAVDAEPEAPQPAEAAAEPAKPAEIVAPSTAVTEAVANTDKAADDKPEKPLTDPAETPVEKAEDESAKMLAANLEAPSNGETNASAQENQPSVKAVQEGGNALPIAGEKRKADDSVGANGDASNKKTIIESASDTPTTNGGAPPRKPGRPKKEKKVPAPVGKTARRTRSQGAAE